MSIRLLPKEPVMLRETSGQDRAIERKKIWQRHPKALIGARAERLCQD